MAIDSSIALGFKQPQFESPINRYAQMLAIENAGNQNALSQYTLSKAKRDDETQNAFLKSVSGLDLNTAEGQAGYKNALARAGKGKEAVEITNALLTQRKTEGDIARGTLETGLKAMDLYRGQLTNIRDPQTAAQWVQAQYADPNLGPIMARIAPMEQAISRIPQEPKQFQTWLQQNALGMEKFITENKGILSSKDKGGTIEDRIYRPLTGEITTVGETQKTNTPGEILTDKRTREEGAANRGVTMRGQNMTDARAGQTYDAERGVIVDTRGGTARPVLSGGQPLGPKDNAPEAMLKAAGYADRMGKASVLLDKFAANGKPGLVEAATAGNPMTANLSRNTERQQYHQAAEDWVRAKLRQESGAVIADEEMAREIRTYFPQIGDKPEVIKQKAGARKVAEQAMITAAGRAIKNKGGSTGGWSVEEVK